MKSLIDLEIDLKNCRTDKQALKAIENAGYKITKDDTKELNSFSVWISDKVRIYKRYKSHDYILQKWHKVKMEYSGIPTFFSTNSYF